ncbi:MAG: hypothetical protein V9E95_06330 [Methanothrix soehngenii]
MDWTAFVNPFCEREKLDTLESAPISLWQHPLYSQSSASGAEKEILSEEEERERAKEMIRASIHQTAIEPPLKKIVIKKKKRWWQFWR